MVLITSNFSTAELFIQPFLGQGGLGSSEKERIGLGNGPSTSVRKEPIISDS